MAFDDAGDDARAFSIDHLGIRSRHEAHFGGGADAMMASPSMASASALGSGIHGEHNRH